MQLSFDVDDRSLRARLEGTLDLLRAALVRKLTIAVFKLESHIKQDKLSGQVLNVVTGALRRSIFSKIESSGDSVTATVASSSDVKYGAIHEFGGIIDIPEIFPVKAKALHWASGGKDVFAKRAQAHQIKMPERSFMRSAFADLKDEIKADIQQAVEEATR